jgi:CTP synthase
LVAKTTGAEVVLVEIGGTVGDIESLPFLEALRQMRSDLGRENSIYIHVTWLPHIGATDELKTKPTQHSARELRSIGISPDFIVARSDYPITEDLREKIALFCDVDRRAVISLVTTPILYEVPLVLDRSGTGEYLLERMGLEARCEPDWAEWERLVAEVQRTKPHVVIALVGKYVELHDAYFSVREALEHAALSLGVVVDISWIQSSDLEKDRSWEEVRKADGILVPGGFGSRGTEGKIRAIRYARENKVPYLGLCLGMQLMVVEFARYLVGNDEPNSTEFDRSTAYPVIDLMPDQRSIADMGGTMRLGLYPCELQPGTVACAAYQKSLVHERHRHRFELNNAYRNMLEEGGMVFSGISPDGRLVEIAEVADHPFMLATQFHPEFLSRPNRPHPLFLAFLRAVRQRAGIETEQKKFEAV